MRNSLEAQKAAHGPESEGGSLPGKGRCPSSPTYRSWPSVSPASTQTLDLKPFVLGKSRTFGLSGLRRL